MVALYSCSLTHFGTERMDKLLIFYRTMNIQLQLEWDLIFCSEGLLWTDVCRKGTGEYDISAYKKILLRIFSL